MDELTLMERYYVACSCGNLNNVKKCVEDGADINGVTMWGWSPFIEACKKGHEHVVTYLLNSGAAIVQPEMFCSKTALMETCERGDIRLTELLLIHDSSINFIRQRSIGTGKTALMYAAGGCNGCNGCSGCNGCNGDQHYDTVKLLLFYDPAKEHLQIKDMWGKTAVNHAKTKQMRELLSAALSTTLSTALSTTLSTAFKCQQFQQKRAKGSV